MLVPLVAHAFVACGGSELPDEHATIHPDERYRAEAPQGAVALVLDPLADAAVPRLLADTLATIDASQMHDSLVTFVRLSAAAVSFDGSTLAIVDDGGASVWIYALDGSLRQRIHNTSDGARGVRSPISVAAAADGSLYVGGLEHTLARYSPTGTDYVAESRITLPVAPRSMCILNDTIVVAGATMDDDVSIRVFDAAGHQVAAFGNMYDSPNRLVNYQLRQGKVACDDINRVIIFASASPLGEVRAYRPNGELVWSLRFPDFVPLGIRDEPPNGYTLLPPSGGFHVLGTPLLIAPSMVAVQVAFVKATGIAAARSPEAVETFLISTIDGSLIGRRRGRTLIATGHADVAVVFSADPYASVIIAQVNR